MNNYFASNLKHLRLQSGMTQNELASKVFKDYSTVGKWELGQRTPSILDLFRIADIFNVSERDLVQKNLTYRNENRRDEFEMFFNKNKDILTGDDKDYIRFIIEKRKKEATKEKKEN